MGWHLSFFASGARDRPMTKSESYDPHTWRGDVDYSRAEGGNPPPVNERASRLGLLLSAILLLGGAALAYGTAGQAPAPSSETVGN